MSITRNSSNSSTPIRRRLNVIVTRWHRLMRIAGDPYRPELHYMRGPGPKWHAKHQGALGAPGADRAESICAA